MGLELANCKGLINDSEFIGKLYLDSTELRFRADQLQWSLKVGKGTNVKVTDGLLTVRRGSRKAVFSIGTKAEKWADKIVNPPNRVTKLGVKAGDGFVLKGPFAASFADELVGQGLVAKRLVKHCEVTFILLRSVKDLKTFEKVFVACRSGTHLWAIWPKGNPSFGQSNVINHARTLGMGPGKKIAFDDSHTAMRFTKK